MAADGRSLAAIEYLHQSLDDADVRKNLARGADAIRRASDQLSGRNNRVTKVSRRARLQRQMREAVTSFGRAGAAAREAELKRQRRRRRQRRLIVVLVAAGIGAGASGSPTVRGKVRDLAGGRDGGDEPQPAAETPEPAAVA